MDEAAIVIQKKWRMRLKIKSEMMDLLYSLHEREKTNLRTYMLIDEFLDKDIDNLLDIYNKMAKRHRLISYETFCALCLVLE